MIRRTGLRPDILEELHGRRARTHRIRHRQVNDTAFYQQVEGGRFIIRVAMRSVARRIKLFKNDSSHLCVQKRSVLVSWVQSTKGDFSVGLRLVIPPTNSRWIQQMRQPGASTSTARIQACHRVQCRRSNLGPQTEVCKRAMPPTECIREIALPLGWLLRCSKLREAPVGSSQWTRSARRTRWRRARRVNKPALPSCVQVGRRSEATRLPPLALSTLQDQERPRNRVVFNHH